MNLYLLSLQLISILRVWYILIWNSFFFDFTSAQKMQSIIRKYFEGSDGIIFVVDGSDNERFQKLFQRENVI